MKRLFHLIFFSVATCILPAQVLYNYSGQTVNNTITGSWSGINIPRSVPTNLYFLNNSITSVNSEGYLLQAGDEGPVSTNNNLNGATVTGNKLTWNGTNPESITHAMFTGYNINYRIKYNYLDKTPYGIIFKSGTDAGVNMTYTSGYGAAYNIVRNAKLSLRMKGINGVQVYNNTFYSSLNSGTIITIDANYDRTIPSPSTGAKIKNNIFYTVKQIYNISVESGSLVNFESDYNVFYCESGTPLFKVDGVVKTFNQWQAMGFDVHSVVKNPDFINTSQFVPRKRLDHGTNIGTDWQTGLSTTAEWIAGTAPAISNQNGLWQVGAIIHPEVSAPVIPVYISSVIEDSSPAVLEMIYNQALANIIPQTSAFTVMVNSTARNISSVAVSSTRVRLTLTSAVVYGDVVTVAYNKPAINPLQTHPGEQAVSISPQPVTNNVTMVIGNKPPVVVVNFPENSFSGFVGEFDASGSYDLDNDILSYTWITPENISFSSSTSPVIKFLGPVVKKPEESVFNLIISDGKTTVSESIIVDILPYKPELDSAEFSNVEASSFQSPYFPNNILDGKIETFWSANGDNQWLIMKLKDFFKVHHVRIAFQPGGQKTFYFDILGSKDGETWTPVLINSESCGFSGNLHVFDFPAIYSTYEFKYIKLVGHSNSEDSWNHISEFRIFGSRHQYPFESEPFRLYPNPAQHIFNIQINDPTLKPESIKIVNLVGKIIYETMADPDLTDFRIPISLIPGIYVVQIRSEKSTMHVQKLIII